MQGVEYDTNINKLGLVRAAQHGELHHKERMSKGCQLLGNSMLVEPRDNTAKAGALLVLLRKVHPLLEEAPAAHDVNSPCY